jgi:uncharacterized membrane protein
VTVTVTDRPKQTYVIILYYFIFFYIILEPRTANSRTGRRSSRTSRRYNKNKEQKINIYFCSGFICDLFLVDILAPIDLVQQKYLIATKRVNAINT